MYICVICVDKTASTSKDSDAGGVLTVESTLSYMM